MKTTLIYGLCLVIGTTLLQAQQFPFLSDPGSMTGSGAALALYKQLDEEDKKNKDKMEDFRKDYVKRQIYFMGTAFPVKNAIAGELDESFSRYDALKIRNNKLSFLSYSKKKDNTKMLNLVDKMLRNLQNEVRNQKTVFVIYGEKINLLQNVMTALIDVHRILDVVEDNLEQTKLYNRIFN
jgi:hypothetical protein